MSCRNRAKVLTVPPLSDSPAAMSDQGFTVRNQHKASTPKEKGKGLAPLEPLEEEDGTDKKDLDIYFVPKPIRSYS